MKSGQADKNLQPQGRTHGESPTQEPAEGVSQPNTTFLSFSQDWFFDMIIGFLRSPRWKTPVMSFLDEYCTVFDDEDENKCPIEFPEYKDPKIYTPRAKLKITLAEPIIMKLSFQIEVMITTRVEEILEMIVDRHDGSILK